MRVIANHTVDGRMPTRTFTIECNEEEMDALYDLVSASTLLIEPDDLESNVFDAIANAL